MIFFGTLKRQFVVNTLQKTLIIKMHYDRLGEGRHVEQTLVDVGCVVLTADQVLHDGDVVGRSGGFGRPLPGRLSVVP